MAKWIAEGLCFKCDEKFHRNHLCAKPELTVLVTNANGTETELTEEPRELVEEVVEDEVEAVVAEVSINSVVGLTSPRTMKLRGSIGDETVVVLIDNGASHNFISEKLVAKLGLSTNDTSRYEVLVAGGMKVHGRGIIEGVELKLPTCDIETSFLPLELGISDIILGLQWLDTLGEMRVNWKLQQMKVWLDERWVLIQGEFDLHSANVSLKSLWKAIGKEGEGMIVDFNSLQILHSFERGEKIGDKAIGVFTHDKA